MTTEKFVPVEGRDFVVTSGRQSVILPGKRRPIWAWRLWLSKWWPIRHRTKDGREFTIRHT